MAFSELNSPRHCRSEMQQHICSGHRVARQERKLKYFSHAQRPTHSEHRLAGQGPKQHCSGKSWMYQYIHAAETETYALARPRRAHGRRMDSQRPPLRRTCAGKTSHRQTTAAIQRFVQEGPKSLEHDPNNWEATALKRSAWRQTVQKGLSKFEDTLAQQHKEKRKRRKAAAHADRPASDFICALCHRDCHSRTGLASHTRRCTRINT